MDATPADRRDDSGFQPGAEAKDEAGGAGGLVEHDCWEEIYASLDDAAALIRRDARHRHVPASEHDDIVQTTIGEAWARRNRPEPVGQVVLLNPRATA